jgi:hypothetical protein
MPLLAINLSDQLFGPIRDLVEKGDYQSPESFLEVAAFNQLALERGATPAEIVDLGHRIIRDSAKVGGAGVQRMEQTEPRKAVHERVPTTVRKRTPKRVGRVVPSSSTIGEHEIAVTLERLANVARGAGMPAPCKGGLDQDEEDHLFGQVNRVFPMKLACRWLATRSASEGKWQRYDMISDCMADDAATVGSLLEHWDYQCGRKRDGQLSTGLPRRGNSSSRDRFLSQFVARVTRGGETYPGAICQYQLARFLDSALVLTEEGLAFALIDNPVLDAKDKSTSTALSANETEFLVRQVLTRLLRERHDMQIVLTAVQAGRRTPSELMAGVQGQLGRDWTESMARTHVSGLVARLTGLGLLRREWEGRQVTYLLGAKAEEFLSA